jgi:hypothetical protein
MSDQGDPRSLPELTPEQETEVRRLLAAARHDEPMPTDVADRLDTVLAGLSRDEPGAHGVAPVVDLAARRRRRNAAALLAGAAAVIVAGFVGGQVIDVGSDDDGGTAASTQADADRAGSANDESAAGATGESQDPAAPGLAPEDVPGPVLQLRSAHLASDLREQLAGYPAADGSVESSAGRAAFAAVGCTPPAPADAFGLGELFRAVYDDTPAVLALRPPTAGAQQADVLDCATAQLLATATIPSR